MQNEILSSIIEQINDNQEMEIIHASIEDAPHAILLRSKLRPDHAIFLWENRGSTNRSQVVFQKTDGSVTNKYAVVCACCPLKSFAWDEEHDQKTRDFNHRAGKQIEAICKAHGIKRLFVRHADVWLKKHFGKMEGISVHEAETLRKLTDRQSLFPFIDWSQSSGI